MRKLFLVLLVVSFGVNAQKRPNIMFIEVDDLNPEFLNKVGGGFGYSPNIDKLAEEGTYFPNAVAQAPMCSPSRNLTMTNLYPHNLGMYRNGNVSRLPDGIWTFPRVLQENGYETSYIGKSHMRPMKGDENWKDRDASLRKYGFDYAETTGERYALWAMLNKKEGKGLEDQPFIKHLKSRGKYEQWLVDNTGWKWDRHSSMPDDLDYLDGYTTQRGMDWFDNRKDDGKPFFLWFNFCLPHDPYDAPNEYFEIADNTTVPERNTSTFGHKVPEPLLKDNHSVKDAETLRLRRRGEVANVAFTDKMVGKLIQKLEDIDLLDNTIIVFFSDHSIFLGNHDRIGKGSLFGEALSTSLIVRYPKEYLQNVVNETPVELTDLAPTVFEMAKIENPNEVAKNGVSFVPVLKGKKKRSRTFGFSEIWGAQGVTDGDYRYIISEGYEMLYDLKVDPYEMNNIATEKVKITKKMRQAVNEWYHGTGEIHPPKTF